MSDRAAARGGAPAALDGAFLLQLLHRPKPAAPSPPPPPPPHSDPAVAAVGPSYAFPPHSFRPPPPPGFTPRPPDSHQNPARPENSHHNYPGARRDAAIVENSRHNYPGARRDAAMVENSRHNYPGADYGDRTPHSRFPLQDGARADNSQHNYPGARRDAAIVENSRHNYPGARREAAIVENSRRNYPGADYGDRTPDSRFPLQDGARADNSPHNYPGARRGAGFRAENLHRGLGPRGNDGFRADSLQHSFRSNDRGFGPRGPGERNAPNGYWKPVGNGGGVDEQRVNGRNFHHGLQGRPQGNYHRPVGEQFENYRRRDNGWVEDYRMNGERWGGRGGRSEYRPSSRGPHPGDAARSNRHSEDGSGRVNSSQNDGVQVSTSGSAADSGGDASEEQDVLADQLMETLTLKDDTGEKKTRRYKDLRLDSFRGHRVSSQRMRIHRRETACRFDIKTFTSNFLSIHKSLIPAEEEKEKQKQLLLMLENLVAKEWPNAQLHIYGSCANSFGFSNSDIDICLAIDDMNMIKSDVLLKLADILQADNLENVQALTHARVPIVKLMDPVTGISCDICINNLLAVVNTKLLRDYAQIDERLPQLAFIVKHWAKSRGVNETYRGTLSSYAYVLMCIHFLQLRRPAILPCLQEMEETYVVTVDDTRCAYFDRVEELHGFGAQNKENIAYLLWAFFQYWAYYYDYTDDVVSVRTGRIISKRSKEWTTRVGNDRHLICIEDPFETSHDLGRVVDKFTIKILREEFERAADILQYNPNPTVTLFEPYVPPAHNQLQSECL